MTLVIKKPTSGKLVMRKGWQPMDSDAATYIAAVEAADGQALEEKTKFAIDNFVLGCKADGIWTAIKASCILAGARTLNGALVPLVGVAPTSFNFVAGDYNRKAGLVADNTGAKYLDANRAATIDPQNSRHLAVWRSLDSTAPNVGYLGNGIFGGAAHLFRQGTNMVTRNNSSTQHTVAASLFTDPCFYGTSRSSSSEFNVRIKGLSYTQIAASQTLSSSSFTLYRVGSTTTNDQLRLAFYSIGEFLDLALLDARVTALINAIGAAIP